MTDYLHVVHQYLKLFPDEQDSLGPVRGFLESTPDAGERVDRKNFKGHLTASCLLVDPVKEKILLFHNPRYNVLLQPGGHFERVTEASIDVATRKVLTETGFPKEQVKYLAYDYDPLVPVDIDTHPISHERRHVHHDLRYVFLHVRSDDVTSVHDEAENLSKHHYVWYDFTELGRLTTFTRLFRKLNQFLSRDGARRRFYVAMTQEFKVVANVNTVVVSHILPDSFEFLDALRRCTNLVGVIPKPKSINTQALKRLADLNIPLWELKREQVAEFLPERLKDHLTQKTILVDIGGWFVPSLASLPKTIADNIAGIVEDTRNGQTKYEHFAASNSIPFPVISVAESALKAREDFQVGRSIVYSTDAILRECGLLLEYMECGIVGYGKIGRSIAHNLQRRGIRPYVVETDQLRRVEAYGDMFPVRDRDWVSHNVDVLFCATGSKATDIIDLRTLKSGAFVFSVTSLDDEFDLDLLPSEYTKSTITAHVDRYDGPQNHFYLVNSGNAVNFLHDAVLGEFIQLVKGALYASVRSLADERPLERSHPDPAASAKGPGFKQLLELGTDDQAAVARLWIETVLLGVRLENV